MSREELVSNLFVAIQDEKLRNALKRIIQVEKELREKYPDKPSWWEWEIGDTGVEPWLVLKLMRLGIVKRTYSSSSHKYHRLVDYDLTVKAISDVDSKKVPIVKNSKGKSKAGCLPVPDSEEELFDLVVGYEDYKWLLWKALKAWEQGKKPAHFLLTGPPASGKSTMLENIEEKIGCVEYIAGEASRRGGFTTRLVNAYSRYGKKFILLLDEVDKMDAEALKIIYNLMEGRLDINVSGKEVHAKNVKIMIIASSNRIDHVPEALKSRFGKPLYFRPYDMETYIKVAANVLVKREKTPRDLAEYIAVKTAEAGVRDPRIARQIARTADTKDDVDKVLKILIKRF